MLISIEDEWFFPQELIVDCVPADLISFKQMQYNNNRLEKLEGRPGKIETRKW